ncbi:MAG TPA: metallophosphoesterase [Xanthobacteraceae bacterium]
MKDVVVVHSSDLHIDHGYPPGLGDATAGLARVLKVAREAEADLVLLAGDTFESHRQPAHLIERAAELFAGADIPVVLLPGNHDPATADAAFRHARLAALDHLHVLGVTHEEAVVFPTLDLEVWGRAHLDYVDMVPFERARTRTTRWQIAMGHGHYEPVADRSRRPRPSWLIGEAEISATGADYVALGHWNRAAKVGNGLPAYYSGSPDYAGTVNVVRLTARGEVVVSRRPIEAG